MSDQAQPPTSGLVILPEVEQKFGPLIVLIKASESMNNEERQYWVNILPIMTPEQIKNLEDILGNEKKQLAAIDAKYSSATASLSGKADNATMEEKIRTKKQQRQKMEQEDAETEQVKEADLMAQIQSL